jgi:4-hydroxy-3-methylbut-2-en-1-yl diphosphate reductase
MTVALQPLKIVLAQPRGFCAGVVRAVDIVERALELHGAPVYVRHQIVHNHHVVKGLVAKGAVFVSELDEVPDGAITVFSAHGVSRAVEDDAGRRRLDVIDATCPLVRKVHMQGKRYAAQGYDVILIGHAGHPEVEGTRGQIPGHLHIVATAAEVEQLVVGQPEKTAYITQTTLSVRDTRDVIVALQKRFPAIVGPDTRDICYATQNRQVAVEAMAPHVDLILVIGAANSSNSNRLREIGETLGRPSYLIDGPEALDMRWFSGVRSVGITAGASAPEALVQDTIAFLSGRRAVTVQTLDGVEENITFRMPERLVPRAMAEARP